MSFAPAFRLDPWHVIGLRAEYASDREIPRDWPCQIVHRGGAKLREQGDAATADGWERRGDDMIDQLAHFHGDAEHWFIAAEDETERSDWTALVQASLELLGERVPLDSPRPADAPRDAGRHDGSDGPLPLAVMPPAPGYTEDDGPVVTLRFTCFIDPAPAEPEPREGLRGAGWPEKPDYSDTPTGRVLADIDTAIDDSLRAANQRLRRQLATAAAERDAALARVAELDLTVRALGTKADDAEKAARLFARVLKHVAGHDAEGGESDG